MMFIGRWTVEMNIDEHKLKFLSKEKFIEFGIDNIAYIKPTKKDGESLYVIHAADGTALVELSQKDAAFAAVKQYEMEPLSLH